MCRRRRRKEIHSPAPSFSSRRRWRKSFCLRNQTAALQPGRTTRSWPGGWAGNSWPPTCLCRHHREWDPCENGTPGEQQRRSSLLCFEAGGGLSAASRRCLRSLRVVVSSALLELCVLADPSSFGHLHCKGADKCCNLLLRALRMCISQHHLCAMSVDRLASHVPLNNSICNESFCAATGFTGYSAIDRRILRGAMHPFCQTSFCNLFLVSLRP